MSDFEDKALRYLHERFGLDNAAFKGLKIFRDRDQLFITTPEAYGFDRLKKAKIGLKLVEVFPSLIKLSTAGVQFLGRFATKNTITLSKDEMRKFVNGELIRYDAGKEVLLPGPVIVFYEKHPLGLAIYRDGLLRSQIPREKRIAKLL